MGKKILIAVGALFALFIVAAIAIPFFVDVDKYRPQIVSKADEYLNGKLEVGKLSLSLWGQVKVKIDGVSISDPSGQKVFSVQDAYFHIPFISLLGGSPELILKIDSPTVLAIKDKRGKLNMLGLVKAQPAAVPPAQGTPGASVAQGTPGAQGAPAAQGAPGPQGTPGAGTPGAQVAQGAKGPQGTQGGASAPPAAGGAVSVPFFVARARIGVEMLHANITYRDATTDLSSQFPDMNLVIQDLSLTRTASIKFWTDIDTTMGKTLAVKGPIKLDGTATPQLVDSKFDHVSLSMKVDLDDLDVSSGAMLHKPKGMACNAEFAVTASAKEAKIEKMNVKFLDAEIESSGSVSNLSGASTPGQPAMVVQFQAKSNSIDFKPWSELIPMLKEYDLSGSANFDASASGPADKLAYKAKLGVVSLSAKGPMLKAKPVINVDVAVSTDKVDHFGLGVKSPGNDLQISGSLTSFTAPRLVAKVTSPGMDLDQLIDFPPPKKANGASAGGNGGVVEAIAAMVEAPAAAAPTAKAAADIDASLAPLRENKMIAGTDAAITTDIKFIKAYGVKISDIGVKMTFKDLSLALEGFKMKVFEGAVKADFSTALKPAHPTYKFAAGVDGLVIEEAVESQLALFKNTLFGKASFTIGGTGASFNSDPAMSNLNAKGNLKVVDATFATIDIGKMVADALNDSLKKAGDKVPPLKGKTIPSGFADHGSSKYDSITSDFTIAGGRFSAPNFVAKAQKDKGIDLKGSTVVGMKDLSLNADWTVIDTYNLSKAHDLSVNVAGTDVPHILAKGNEPVQFPVHLGGTLLSPEKSYTQVPEYFANVALANVSGAASGKAKSQAQQQIQKFIPKGAPPAVQNSIGGLTKKLFGQ